MNSITPVPDVDVIERAFEVVRAQFKSVMSLVAQDLANWCNANADRFNFVDAWLFPEGVSIAGEKPDESSGLKGHVLAFKLVFRFEEPVVKTFDNSTVTELYLHLYNERPEFHFHIACDQFVGVDPADAGIGTPSKDGFEETPDGTRCVYKRGMKSAPESTDLTLLQQPPGIERKA